MELTLISRGIPIATTDLGFVHFGGPSRSGWLHPTADGEKIVARIASPLPAMRAYFMRDVCGRDGKSIVQPEYLQSELFADLAAQVQHVSALGLELRRDDGSLLATTHIGVQDMEELRAIGQAMVEKLEEEAATRGWEPEEGLEDSDEIGSDAFVTIIDGETGEVTPWEPDEDAMPSFPRYQIHVMLADEGDLPGRQLPAP